MAVKKTTRTPTDKLNGYDTREAVWEVIRQLRKFTIRDLCMKITLNIGSVRDYCIGLERAGYLKELLAPAVEADRRFVAKEYELIKDVGATAPRVRKDGTAVVQGLGREQMWRTMRILKKFCVRELTVTSSTEECVVKESTASEYCIMLCRAGYLRRTAPACYLFLPHHYTGPRPPMIQRTKQVYDPNLHKVMWRTGDEEAANGK